MDNSRRLIIFDVCLDNRKIKNKQVNQSWPGIFRQVQHANAAGVRGVPANTYKFPFLEARTMDGLSSAVQGWNTAGGVRGWLALLKRRDY